MEEERGKVAWWECVYRGCKKVVLRAGVYLFYIDFLLSFFFSVLHIHPLLLHSVCEHRVAFDRVSGPISAST